MISAPARSRLVETYSGERKEIRLSHHTEPVGLPTGIGNDVKRLFAQLYATSAAETSTRRPPHHMRSSLPNGSSKPYFRAEPSRTNLLKLLEAQESLGLTPRLQITVEIPLPDMFSYSLADFADGLDGKRADA